MFVRALLYGTLGSGALYGGFKVASGDDLDPYNIGVARFGRAALTVSGKINVLLLFVTTIITIILCCRWVGLGTTTSGVSTRPGQSPPAARSTRHSSPAVTPDPRKSCSSCAATTADASLK